MKISEAFYQTLKHPIWIFVFVLLFGFVIYTHITLPLKLTFNRIFFLLAAFFLAIIIFSVSVNLLHFIEFQSIRDFQNRLWQLNLRIKFLFFCFSFEGEYENKKFEITLLPFPAFPTPNLMIIYRLYSHFPFGVIIKKDVLTQKTQLKTHNLERVKSYLERKEIQEAAKELIDIFGKIEISHQWVQISQVTPFVTFMFLFRTHLTPEKVNNIAEKLKILTKL